MILRAIYDQDEISRADIARMTGLTRTTVSDAVSELMQEGLVAETGVGVSAGGKPPILLSIVEDSRSLIGVDLANSEFRGAIINLRGEIRHRFSLPIDEQDGEAALALVYRLIDRLVSVAESPILGIGIGTPGLMDAQQGVVRTAVNLDWRDLPLGDLLEGRYALPVYIANDCQVAALAELTFGIGKALSNLVVIKVGRGIGSGIILDRQLHYGDGFGAGEIGHMVVEPGGELCRCGNHGCLETLASSRAIVKRIRTIAESNPRSLIHRFAPTPAAINTNVVLQAFDAGDEAVQAVIEEAGCYLGKAVAYLESVLNIQQIVITGSMARFGQALIEPIKQQVNEGVLPALTNETRIEISDLGQDIVILGAAALLLSHEMGLS